VKTVIHFYELGGQRIMKFFDLFSSELLFQNKAVLDSCGNIGNRLLIAR